MAAAGRPSLIKTLLVQYFNRIVYTPFWGMNYNFAVKISLRLNKLSAQEHIYEEKNFRKLIVTVQ